MHHRTSSSAPETTSIAAFIVKTVQGWVRRGVVPGFRLGGRRLIDLEAVHALIDDRREELDRGA